MINSLRPDLLRSVVAVAQTKSFSRAAERVHLSQSTVSQQIRRLEGWSENRCSNGTLAP